MPVDLTDIKKPKIHPEEFPIFGESVLSAWEKASGCYVEIGTNKAKGTAALMQLFSRYQLTATIHTIDLAEYAQAAFLAQWKKFGVDLDVFFLYGSSHDPEIIDRVKEGICWLWIDGCHCFDCVSTDIELWFPKVVDGGFILFHDCNPTQITKRNVCSRTDHKHRVGVAGAIAQCGLIESGEMQLETKGPRRRGIPGLDVYRKRAR